MDIKDVGETTRLFTPRIPTSSIFGQRWVLKVIPTECSWMELRDYLVTHGQKPYPLWDQATGKIKDVEPASGDDEVLHRAQAGGGGCVKLMDNQLKKMRKRLLYGPDQEGEGGEEEDPPESDDAVSEFSGKSDYNVIHDLVSDGEAERERTSKVRFDTYFKSKGY